MILRAVELRERFGLAVRARRLELGRTQRQLAEKASITEKYLSRIENGEVDASLAIAHRLASSLDVGLDTLLQTKPSALKISPARADFQRFVAQLDDADLSRAHALLHEVVRVYGSSKKASAKARAARS